MFTRYLVLLGVVFAITLAVVVGERLPAEALAVMVGVAAGVAASVPTSLIVVWFANRAATLQASLQVPPAPPAAAREARIVVVAPARRSADWRAPAATREGARGYAPSGYAPADYSPDDYGPEPPALRPRCITLGEAGMDANPDGAEWTDDMVEEVVWER